MRLWESLLGKVGQTVESTHEIEPPTNRDYTLPLVNSLTCLTRLPHCEQTRLTRSSFELARFIRHAI